jgi:membrane associated rhomboid family serine protease
MTAGQTNWRARAAGSAYGLMAGFLAAIWLIELLDTVLLGDRLQRNGIQPRDLGGLDGILWAPFLHLGWGHVLSNTVPFTVLGGLVALRGRSRWLAVTAVTIGLGGLLTWLLGASGTHIGASGVVFGYFGALLGAAAFERRPAAIAPALVALLLYYGIIVGLVPQRGISWEGHLFGLIAGLAGAKLITNTRRRPADDHEVDLSAFPPDFDFGQPDR